jgi:DNA-binding winged helix-turn-helix (wHTH) protein
MGEARLSAAARRQPRHWSFASCQFDEANWTLTVDSQRVSVESKPLEILRELLVRAGAIVSKDELLDLIWPNVTVVEASLPTAIHKLRVALGDNKRERGIIETVPGVGYRLAVPVQLEQRPAPNGSVAAIDRVAPTVPDQPADAVSEHAIVGAIPNRRLGFVAAAGAIALVAVAFALASSRQDASANEARPFGQREAANAVRRLDVDAIERLLATGWNPVTPFDDEGNDALNYLLNRCEWDPQHDQRRMLLMARTLIDGGARIDRRNIWGDTAYSIAKADRYCGPNHPVTQMIRSLCYDGFLPYGDRCLASYELARRTR